MQRVVGLFVLVLCACVTAGCGGSSLQVKARRFLHDPDARVVRSETVQLNAGTGWTRETMTLVKGSRMLRVPCVEMKPETKSSSHTCPRSRYALLGFSATTHALGRWAGLSPAELAAIATARQAIPKLRIFPDLPLAAVRCAVPRANPSGATVPGYCSTDASPNGHLMRVDFLAEWPLNLKEQQKGAEWIVMVSRDGHVQRIHENRTARTYG
jgi:hypothetical protein